MDSSLFDNAHESVGNERLPISDVVEDVVAQRIISYQGDQLLTVLTARNTIYLSIPTMCVALGINARGQLQRIQRTSELAEGLCQFPLKTRGGKQRVNCLLLSKVSSWLSSLQLQSLSSESQSKIGHYQAEIVQVVTQSFLTMLTQEGVPPSPTPLPFSDVMLVEQGINESPLVISEIPLDGEQQELRSLFTSIPYISSTTMLTTTSFQEDRAIREATLAHKAGWEEEPEFKRMRYIASNQLHVYVGDPDNPLGISEALQRIRALGESTILTARILLGLWNIRRCDNQLAKDGSAAIRVDEILEWRGVQKHTRVYAGSEKRFTDGYQWKHKQQVHQDVKLLEQCYLRGRHAVIVKGRVRRFLIDGPYLRVTSVKETTQIEEGEPVGYFIAPGAWINTYEEHGNVFFAEIDRRVFQLNPQNDQIALRIALYLTEYWRQHARTGDYNRPLMMRDLLVASMVSIDEGHLTTRFAPRVEAALRKLVDQGVVGECRPLSEPDTSKAHWGKEWLEVHWCILPPYELMQHYMKKVPEAIATDPLVIESISTKRPKKSL